MSEVLTEEHLKDLGFTCVKDERYINGNQWLLQVSNDYVDSDNGEIVNKDGTWFDAIGTYSFKRDGAMAVNTLCRGNYVCRSVDTVKDVQLLFLALTGKNLELKTAVL